MLRDRSLHEYIFCTLISFQWFENVNYKVRIVLASMAAVQAEDVRASFRFVGDLNGHHQELFGSTTTNRHGVAAFDFATVSGCDQLVVGPTHAWVVHGVSAQPMHT